MRLSRCGVRLCVMSPATTPAPYNLANAKIRAIISVSPPNGIENKTNRPAKLAARKIREALQLGTKEVMVAKSLYHDALITLRHLAPSVFFKVAELLAREGGRQKAV